MTLQRADIEKIAHLARLELSEQELQNLGDNLSQILGLIDQMNAIDTAGVAPMAHPQDDAALRRRPDVVTESDQHEKFQRIAPATEAGLYLVPKVLD